MIPVSLTIKGIYSYQQEQYIDFSKLLEGQLFGIFGTVGSGKSSILEAITYALYGDTERMNSKDNRSYNMMNLKSNELLIDFIFNNFDNNQYRFLVRGKRNTKNFEKVGTLERSAYKWVNNTWEPLESASGETIIGLSYDNFKRTIIIPQGKFQDFLQLGDSDRTKMLKDIFQLDKYEFFFQTAALEQSNRESIQLLTGELAVYASISEELILENENSVNSLKKELQELQEKVKHKEIAFAELEKTKQLHLDLIKCEELLKSLENKASYFFELKKKISDFEYCAIHFKELINKLKVTDLEINKLEQNISQLTIDLGDSNNNLFEAEIELAKWKSHIDLRDINRSKIEDYNILIKVILANKELSKIEERIPAGEAFLKEVAGNRLALQEGLIKKKETLKAKKSSLPDLNELSEIRTWFVKYNHINEILKQDKLNIESKESEWKELEKEVSEILNDSIFQSKAILDLDTANNAIKVIELEITESEIEYRDLITTYEVQVKLGEFSSTLKTGEPCLLCGALDHPQISVIEDVHEHINRCKLKLQELNIKKLYINKLSKNISVIIQRKSDLYNQIEAAKLKLTESGKDIENLKESFIWKGFSLNDESLVSQSFSNARQVGEEIKNLELEEEKIQSDIIEAETKFNKYKEGVDNLHRQANDKKSEVKTLEQQVKGDYTSSLIDETIESLEEKLNKLTAFINEVEVNYELYLNKVNTEKQNNLLINERLSTAKSRLKEQNLELENQQSKLQTEIGKTAFKDIEEVNGILSNTSDWTQHKADLKNYEEQLFSCNQNYNKIKSLIGDKAFKTNDYDVFVNDFLLLKEAYQNLNNDFIKTEALLVKYQKEYQHKQNLEKQLSKLKDRSENINVLKNLFKGSGFVSYISSVYLNQLCESANERFYKLSRQQLRLEVTEKNDFQVRDYLNDGRVRSVKTLSGGQTFQASLALALALAESVQQQNKAMQNFFFLDEGFGSLDKESLQIAFETLKSLRKENRIVGVISHVEDLQQEIDVFLNVSNSLSEGSAVKGSWE